MRLHSAGPSFTSLSVCLACAYRSMWLMAECRMCMCAWNVICEKSAISYQELLLLLLLHTIEPRATTTQIVHKHSSETTHISCHRRRVWLVCNAKHYKIYWRTTTAHTLNGCGQRVICGCVVVERRGHSCVEPRHFHCGMHRVQHSVRQRSLPKTQ